MTLLLTWKAILIFVIMTYIFTRDGIFVSAFTTTMIRKPQQLDWYDATIHSNQHPKWSYLALPTARTITATTTSSSTLYSRNRNDKDDSDDIEPKDDWRRWLAGMTLGVMIMLSSSSSPNNLLPLLNSVAYADTTSTTTTTKNYDGFAEYAKENQMEQSDVACFINQCGTQTKELFRNPRGIKGIVCLGKCKGEQSCATRCFAQYSSPALNEWLSCTIEEEGCVKVPKKAIDNSAEQLGYPTTIKKFDPSTLVGTWYKTDGLNPNYDLFDCQTNTFHPVIGNDGNNKKIKELDMDIFFRVQRPIENGGGYWENQLTEHMIVDDVPSTTTDTTTTASTATTDDQYNNENEIDTTGSTMHTSGKMYGLQFYENWYILGESDGTTNDIPPFKLVAYKGHTLQGNYEGAFVYAKEPTLPVAAIPAVEAAAQRAGLNFKEFTKIDNTCPSTEGPLNDELAGTGTSTMDWFDLITGEGGVIDWISPGWRGEYSAKK